VSYFPVVLSALLLAACGQQQPAGRESAGEAGKPAAAPANVASATGKVSVEFWHYFGGDHVKVIKEFISQFEAENPDITISPVFQGRPNELSQKIQSSFATTPSNNPVLATVYENWTSDYVTKGLMDAVEDHFGGPDGLSEEEQKDIVEVFREGNSWNGKMITMPFNKSVYLLYINMDRLAKAGFTTAPKTLAEFKDAVSKCTEREDGRIKTYGLGVAPASEAFTTIYYASNGSYMDASGNPAFDNPTAVSALTFLRDLQYPEKQLYVSTDYMDAPFGNQQIAMYIYSSASFPYNARSVGDRFKWAVAPIPQAEGVEPRYLMQGTNIGIFKNRPEAERKAAWKFIKFLTSTKNCAVWETQTGYMPIRYSVLKEPKMVEYMEKNPRYAAASVLVLENKGKQEPNLAVWEGARQDLGLMVDQVLSKGADPKTVLADTLKKTVDRMNRAAGK
jgi:multiple sugar transport system substrate-binding protein